MATVFNIAEMTADVARRCNVPTFSSTTNVTSGQVTYWLTQSARSLSALLRQKQCEDNDLLTSATLTTIADFELVSLPADCGEIHALIWQKSSSDYRLLEPAALDDFQESTAPTQAWGSAPMYRLEGNTIRFLPASTEAETLTLIYTNHLDLAGETNFQSRLDADLWITLTVCERVLQSKGRDASPISAEKAMLETNLFSSARRRDAYGPSTIRDVRSRRGRTASRDRWWRY